MKGFNSEIDDRRNYFRVDDVAFLSYRLVSLEEIKLSQASSSNLPVHKHTIKANFDRLTRELQPLYNVIKTHNNSVAEYLAKLDKKITLLSEYVFHEDTIENDIELQRINIGGGGLVFVSEKPLNAGSMLELRIKLLPEQICIFTYAKVISCAQFVDDESIEAYRVSVEYESMDDDVRDMITRHVLHKERAQLNSTESM